MVAGTAHRRGGCSNALLPDWQQRVSLIWLSKVRPSVPHLAQSLIWLSLSSGSAYALYPAEACVPYVAQQGAPRHMAFTPKLRTPGGLVPQAAHQYPKGARAMWPLPQGGPSGSRGPLFPKGPPLAQPWRNVESKGSGAEARHMASTPGAPLWLNKLPPSS